MLTLEQISYKDITNYKNLLDLVYPIGALYISFESTSPAELLGGSWTQITTGVLRASNNTTTGGNDDMIIPYHNHSASSSTQSANHTHRLSDWILSFSEGADPASMHLGRTMKNNTGDNHYYSFNNKPPESRYTTSANSASHSHTITVNYTGTSGNTTNANLPKYQNIYVWRRVS